LRSIILPPIFHCLSFYALQTLSESRKLQLRVEFCQMSGDSSVSQSWQAKLRKHFTFRQILVNAGLVIYCLALLLLFDFVYSFLTAGEDARKVRIPNPIYDHGFAANSDGYDVWGSCGIG
jgi:hypothetical protein